MTRPRLSAHAADRLRERFGWSGTADEAVAQLVIAAPCLADLGAVQGAVKAKIRPLGIRLIIKDGVIVTVLDEALQRVHEARQGSLKRAKSQQRGPRQGCGTRALRSRRPEQEPDFEDEE